MPHNLSALDEKWNEKMTQESLSLTASTTTLTQPRCVFHSKRPLSEGLFTKKQV